MDTGKITDQFPLESVRSFLNTPPPDISTARDYKVKSYDNQGRISDFAALLRLKLGKFQTRIAASSFLSDSFSWQVKTAESSDSERLIAKALPSASEKDYSITIDRLANFRTAESDKLDSDDASDFRTGTYSFSLTIGSDTYSIDINIQNKPGDPATNRSVLLAVERSINRLGLDVTAELRDMNHQDYSPFRENMYKNISWLVVSAEKTGDDIQFSLKDKTGDLIAGLGLDRITSFGRQNLYQINGENGGSDSNHIVTDSGRVDAWLSGVTESGENLKLTIKQDTESLGSELVGIINDYNDLIKWIDENDYVISPGLKSELFRDVAGIAIQDRALRTSSSSSSASGGNLANPLDNPASAVTASVDAGIDKAFSDIGLTLNHDGTIAVSDDFMSYVAGSTRQVYDALGGENGFFSAISRAITSIHGRSENNYITSFNSIISYDESGSGRPSAYKSGLSSIISLFA